MSGKHLLDTNIVIAVFKGEANVQAEMSKNPGGVCSRDRNWRTVFWCFPFIGCCTSLVQLNDSDA